MTLEEAKTHVLDNHLELLARLGEYRHAIYEECTAHSSAHAGRVADTNKARQSAFDHRARLGLATQKASTRLYSLLTAGIDDIIDREEANHVD